MSTREKLADLCGAFLLVLLLYLGAMAAYTFQPDAEATTAEVTHE